MYTTLSACDVYMYTTCTQHVYNIIGLRCIQHVYNMYTTLSACDVYNIYTTCMQHYQPVMYTTCIQHVYNMYATCIQHSSEKELEKIQPNVKAIHHQLNHKQPVCSIIQGQKINCIQKRSELSSPKK